jgi:hypothetical protein
MGHYESARNFLALDPGTQLIQSMSIGLLLREGKRKEGIDRIRVQGHLSPTLVACLTGRPASEVAKLAREEAADALRSRDSEPKYNVAAGLAQCGQTDLALQLLKTAVEQNYCAWPAMDKDTALASVRAQPEFAAVRQAGIACQQRFLAHRDAAKPR